jgi:hypothetical protein
MFLREFDKETTPAMWRKKGMELFDDEQFGPAARCFEASGDYAWAQAQGKHLHETGNKLRPRNLIVEQSEFYTGGDFPKVLDLLL